MMQIDSEIWGIVSQNLEKRDLLSFRWTCQAFYKMLSFEIAAMSLVSRLGELISYDKMPSSKCPNFYNLLLDTEILNKEQKGRIVHHLIRNKFRDNFVEKSIKKHEIPVCICSFACDDILYLKRAGINPELGCTATCGEMSTPYGQDPCVEELIKAMFYS